MDNIVINWPIISIYYRAMHGKKNVLTIIISVIVSLLIIEFSLRIIGFKEYEFKGYPPYYLTTVGDYYNFDIRDNPLIYVEGNKFMSEKIYNKLLDNNIIDIEVN